MKLKEFIPTQNKKASISLSKSKGVVRISSLLAELAGAKEGTHVQVFQDEEEPSDWYLKFNAPQGHLLRKKSSRGGGYIFNCKSLIDAIKFSVDNKQGKRWCIPVATEPDPEYGVYAILTSALK